MTPKRLDKLEMHLKDSIPVDNNPWIESRN